MAAPATRSTAEDIKAFTRRLVEEYWNQGNIELAGEIVADDYERIELFSTERQHGPEGLKKAAATWRGAFPDLHLTLDDMLAEGDMLACQWTFTGTHKGELNGTAATGRSVRVSGLSILKFANGKIVTETVSTDLLGLMKQLGVILS